MDIDFYTDKNSAFLLSDKLYYTVNLSKSHSQRLPSQIQIGIYKEGYV